MVLQSRTSSRMYDYKSVSERETELPKAEENVMVKCISCKKRYGESEAGTCKECYEEASKTKEELKREIDDLKFKISFLRLPSPPLNLLPFADLLLLPYSGDVNCHIPPSPLPASTLTRPSSHLHISLNSTLKSHLFVHFYQMSRSPVFKAILEKTRSGTIKIVDVSYDVLRSFVHYLYTAEVLLDERMTCDLLVLAKKYQVKHLKSYCEKFMTSKVNSENAIVTFTFAH
ncbi:BTB/POZ domain-containing protein [Acorus calamus]|uniref:BTB/POZ domain-containing protein n=1 Tax=Acorus calamus TaxID=4465 RepID=A0AAV9DJE0_ACOCL|nr:BTB/POZ domain-containing protein [Acorus calamus]